MNSEKPRPTKCEKKNCPSASKSNRNTFLYPEEICLVISETQTDHFYHFWTVFAIKLAMPPPRCTTLGVVARLFAGKIACVQVWV
jgi:hypothetical protein